jgi:hypothetical protein
MLYLDVRKNRRLSANQAQRMGLLKANPEWLVELVASHNIDTRIYIAKDTGTQEIREDGKAYIIHESAQRKSVEPTEDNDGFSVKDALTDVVNETYGMRMTSGIQFTFDGESHILQTRDGEDLLNWMSLKSEVKAMAAGTPIDLRTEGNVTLTMNSEDVGDLLTTGTAHLYAIKKAAWAIKDGINAAETDADAYTAFEIGMTTLWPESSVIAVPAE